MLNKNLIFLISALSVVSMAVSAMAADVTPGSKPHSAELQRSSMRTFGGSGAREIGIGAQGAARAIRKKAKLVEAVINPSSQRAQPDAIHPARQSDARLAGHNRTSQPNASSFVNPSVIYEFSGISTSAQRQQLELQLLNIEPNLKIATSSDLLNSSSACASSKAICVIVSEKALSAFNQSASALPSHQSVGMIASRRQHPSANRLSGYPASNGSNAFSYDNSNPNSYFIPDLSNQYAGAYFPSSMNGVISSTSMITHVSANVNIYHTYQHDLKIYLGVDDGVNDYYEVKVNQTGSGSGFHTYPLSSDYFDGLSPLDAFFYIDAYDMQAQDTGYINYIDFQVDWLDYTNLTFYNPSNTSFNSVSVIGEHTLNATSTVMNNSAIDVSNLFSIGWYVEYDTSVTKNCSALSYNPSSPNVWSAAYKDFSGMPYSSYSMVSTGPVDLDLVAANSSGYMPNGNYCVWAYVDDLDEVLEWDEDASVDPALVPWDNINYLGKFSYHYQANKPDLTFDFNSSNNTFVPGLTLNAKSVLKNDSITASPFNGGEIAWYLTELPNGLTCSSSSLVLDANSAYFAGAKTLPALSGGATAVMTAPPSNLSYAQNAYGGYLENGKKYCLWAWADDLNSVAEGNEDNNVIVYGSSYTYIDPATGIKNNSNNLSMKVFPNPATSFVNIELPFSLSKEVSVTVLSIDGRVVSQSIEQGPRIRLDVNQLEVGEYLIDVVSGDEHGVQKILKIRE